MAPDLRLVIFDVDGTLVDSQNHIQAAMDHAFAALDLPAPGLSQTLAIVGLSLPQAIARLAPDLSEEVQARIVRHYKDSFSDRRAATPAPLYPGAAEALAGLRRRSRHGPRRVIPRCGTSSPRACSPRSVRSSCGGSRRCMSSTR
mgnify:CR=1 FL=1